MQGFINLLLIHVIIICESLQTIQKLKKVKTWSFSRNYNPNNKSLRGIKMKLINIESIIMKMTMIKREVTTNLERNSLKMTKSLKY